MTARPARIEKSVAMAAADEALPRAPGLSDLDVAARDYARLRDAADETERNRLREQMIRDCMPFAGRLSRRFAGRGEATEDLEQVARLGLVNAVDRYDPARGSFTAYAVVTISGEIKRHFRDRTWAVHVPRRLQDMSLEIGHATVLLTTRLSRRPTDAELAEHLQVPVEVVAEAVESAAGYTPVSLNTRTAGGSGQAELLDLLGGVDGDLELVDDRLTVSRLLLRLPARERRMLAMRFYGNRTQTEIAAELGISQMHVSRLLSRALSWLREAMLTDDVPVWDATHEEHGLRIEVHDGSAARTVQVSGEIDRDAADALRRRLRGALRSDGYARLVVDLRGVVLVDAAGLAVLLEVAQTARIVGVGFDLVGAQPYVARILEVAGLRARLP
jgi:RNA polymerase sigma-B factor